MSTINHASGSYMSNAEIIGWMQAKTGGLYQKMKDAMEVSDSRADLEEAINEAKGLIMQGQGQGHADPILVSQKLQEIKEKFGDSFPEAIDSLEHVAGELSKRFENAGADPYPTEGNNKTALVHIDEKDATRWSQELGDLVGTLGKDDQLGMINIQEFNAQINQAKQTASALIDAANKSSSAIINNIG